MEYLQHNLMKIFYSILFIFLFNLVKSQNQIQINDDKNSLEFYQNLDKTLFRYSLKSIENSNEKTIRIWRATEVFEFSNNPFYLRRFENLKSGEIHIFKQDLNTNLIDSLNINKVKNFIAEYWIDCLPIAIEIVEGNNYMVKEIGCNKEFRSTIYEIFKDEIENNIEEFKKTLSSGIYNEGMTTFIINQPVNQESKKSNFYKKIEKELLQTHIKIDNPTKQPLIKVNFENIYFGDLNKLEESNVKSYKILSKKQGNVFGTRGENGVILIETK